MLIRFFKPPNPASLFAIPFIALIFWIPAFIKPLAPNIIESMPLYQMLMNFFLKIPYWITLIFSVIVLSFEAIFLVQIINKHEVLYKQSHLPSLFLVLFMSLMPQFLWLHPILFSNIFLLFAMDKIFSLYKSNSPLKLTFDAGSLIAIASLFYLPSAIFFLLLFISLMILRPYAWRDYVASFIGFLIPYFFISVYYFWNENFEDFRKFVIPTSLPDVQKIYVQTNIYGLILFSAIGLLFFLSLLKARANFYKNNIRTRKYQLVALVFLFIAISLFLLKGDKEPFHFTIVALPISVFIAYLFLALKKIWILESVLWLIIIVLTVQHISLMIN